MEMEDLLSMSEDFRARRRRRVIYAVLILYFVGLFIYTIQISQERMPFFTRVVGYDSYENGSQLTMRVSAIGTREQLPLENIQARLDLAQPARNTSFKVFEGASNGKAYVDIMVPLPQMDVGDYLARLTVSSPSYGEEVEEFHLEITDRKPGRAVDVQRLDERNTRRAKPISVTELSEPAEIRLISNNGRFVPNLNNSILLVAETLPDRLPLAKLKVDVKAGGKTIANVTTDEMGYATFNYYPHTMGGEKLSLTLTDEKAKTQTVEGELRPFGSQVVAKPKAYLMPVGMPLRFRMETLSDGVWNIDLIHYGNWIMSIRQEMMGAAALVDIPVPSNIQGPLQVQIAKGTDAPNTAYEVFQVFYYDPAVAVVDPEDPRLKNGEPDETAMARMKLEKPFAKLWSYANGNPLFGADIVQNWQKKLNSMGLKNIPFNPETLADELLRDVQKDFILLPELLNTQESRQKAFAEKQRNKRDNALILLAVSGLFVIGLVGFRIWRELQSRESSEEGIENDRSHLTGLVVLVIIIILAYGSMLYMMSMLDWWKGM
jgi:hypothetical protein